MRTIGNIERFLVIGIVVVIGAILAVAIKGADDLDGAYKKQVQAKSNEGRKLGGTPLNRTDPMRGPTGPAAPAAPKTDGKGDADRGAIGTDPAQLSDAVQRFLNGKKPGETGHVDPATPPNGTVQTGTSEKPDVSKGSPAAPPPGVDPGGAAAKSDGDAQAPVVIKDDPKVASEAPVAGRLGADSPKNDAKKVEPASSALDWTYEVQPGDRLERIANTLYGERSMWKEILAANPAFPDPSHIRAGAILTLPKAPTNTTAVGLAHGGAKSPAVAAQDDRHDSKVAESGNGHAAATKPAASDTKSATFKRVTDTDQYEVQKGDTLMAIAAAHYGTRAAWRMILGANTERIADKDHIKPGTVLKLPAQ